MDLEIGNQDFVQKGAPTNSPKKTGKRKHPGKLKIPHDKIVSGKGSLLLKVIFNSSRPVLFQSRRMPINFDKFVKEKVQKHELPSPRKLLERLTPKTRRLLTKLQDAEGEIDPNKYLKLLSKMLPLALTFVQSVSKKMEMEEAPPTEIKEKVIAKDKEQPTAKIQEKVITEIKEIAKTLEKNIKGKELEEFTELVTKLPTALKKPVELQKLLQTMTKQVTELKESLPLPKGQIKVLQNLVKTLTTVQAFPTKDHPQVYQAITTSTIFTQTPLAPIGPQIKLFTQDIAQLIIKILPETTQPIPQKQAGEYLSKSFEQVILAGVILGRTLVDRGDGKPVSIEEVESEKFMQLEVAKELKIIDQFPFSLFALFAPFEQNEKDQSEVIKQAKAATMQLVRLLIRLVIILVAIQTGGQKIGEGGVKLMLNEYRGYILNILDDLIFSFKKISEIFGVKVKKSLRYLITAKNALRKDEHPSFWKNIFTLFSERSDIKNFLEEVKDADPLYDAINSLLASENIDPTTFPM